ncbi:hypothetical protein BASA61_005532 [Batrachochytrium salamandrivorans]|nr:hypothetical protein BASA62_006707 [Batrachochytrium salamandrivorans]KAH6589652.1 hypothetical protein BASA61_005532 [Batrachochytrium salamandrivorans]
MKFNALVVAAMVITSVNASGKGRPSEVEDNGGRSKPGPSQNPPVYKPNESQDSEPEENPICDNILDELFTLWDDVIDLDSEFQERMSVLYGLIMTKADSKTERIRAWLELYPGDIPKLREVKEKYTGFEANRGEIWERLDKNKCPTRYFDLVSQEAMTKDKYFPKWYDSDGADILRKQ